MRLSALFGGIILLSASFGAMNSRAQQTPLSSLYNENRYMFNPANAGDHDYLAAYFNFRNQWDGIAGSPTTGWITVHSPIMKNMSVGAILMKDKTHIIDRISGQLTYAYHLKIAKEHVITFGVSGGFFETKLDFRDVVVQDPNDVILQNGNQLSGVTANVDVGIRYNWKGLEIGGSVPQLLETSSQFEQDNNNDQFQLIRHFNAFAAYEFKIKEDWSLEPNVRFRMAPNTPFSLDAGLKAGWKDIIWLSGAYRVDQGAIIGGGIRIAKKVSLGYAYGLAQSGLSANSNWSHEVMVGWHFTKQKDLKKMENDIKDLFAKQNELDSITDSHGIALDSTNAKLSRLEDEMGANERVAALEDEVEALRILVESGLDTIKDIVTQIILSKGPDGSTEYTEVSLQSGYYVVIESFRTIERAEKAVGIWKEKGTNAIIVHNKQRKWYYVYSVRFDDLDTALKEMRETRKKGVPKAWVHIYNIKK